MLYQELQAVKNQKAQLLKRLMGAKRATKKKKPHKKKRLNPVRGSKLLQLSNRHLRNNSIKNSINRTGNDSINHNEKPLKRGRGYHMINDFRHSRGPMSSDQFSVFRSTVDSNHAQNRAGNGKKDVKIWANCEKGDCDTEHARIGCICGLSPKMFDMDTWHGRDRGPSSRGLLNIGRKLPCRRGKTVLPGKC